MLGACDSAEPLGGDADPADARAAQAEELADAAARFAAVAGQAADARTVRGILSPGDGEPPTQSQIVAALDWTLAAGEAVEVPVEVIASCYEAQSYWLIRLKCLELLLAKDPEEGLERARAEIEGTDFPLEGKILLARALVPRGHLFVYPVLEEALQSEKPIERTLAEGLFQAFQPYDGRVWSEAGDRIDLAALRAGDAP